MLDLTLIFPLCKIETNKLPAKQTGNDSVVRRYVINKNYKYQDQQQIYQK
jgi:hypothetical protein